MLSQILRHEETKSTFATLQVVRQKTSQKSYHVETPGEEGWEPVTEERNMTAALRQEFINHFTQTKITPFLTSGMDDTLRKMFASEPYDTWDDKIKNLEWIFAKQFRITETNNDLIDSQDIIDGFHKWKEKKSI